MNDIAERRNRTLLKAVRAMMSKTDLPKSLWMHALMTVVYVANQVPSKAVFDQLKVNCGKVGNRV
jgi:hypothetical protein